MHLNGINPPGWGEISDDQPPMAVGPVTGDPSPTKKTGPGTDDPPPIV
jgi:hypothetical protein